MTSAAPEQASPAEPVREPVAVVTNGPPLMVAHCIGGRLELYDNCMRIRRDGYVNYLLNWLAGRPAFIDTSIPLEEVSSFDIIQPVLFNDFVVIAYPGSPPLTGRSLYDSMAENALLMGFFDNREFYALKREFHHGAPRAGLQPAFRPATPSAPAPGSMEIAHWTLSRS